jgi:hypothetical protein
VVLDLELVVDVVENRAAADHVVKVGVYTGKVYTVA